MTIKRNHKGQFTTGNNSGKRFTTESSKGNQHAKGNPPNKTSFKEGEHSLDKHPNWKGGVQYAGKDCVYIAVGPNVRARRPVFVWESVYGKLPKGHVIIHKDGDRYNDDINNLEAITRAEMMRRNAR